MICTLKVIDDIEMAYVTNIDDVDYRVERTQSFRSNVLYLVSFKQLIDNEKQGYEEQTY